MLTSASQVLVIDEPERHLHRAISGRLIAAAIAERTDCHFVILTHDLDLSGQLAPGITQRFVLYSCRWHDAKAVGWDLHAVEGDDELPEESRRALLGGRHRILFVEGDNDNSLDYHLYSVLYPDRTIVPCGGADQVIRNVAGIRDSEKYHWIDAVGIIDGDAREQDGVATLESKGVFVLPVNEVENVYYIAPLRAAVALALSEGTGGDCQVMTDTARAEALNALNKSGALENMAADIALKRMRRIIAAKTPAKDQLKSGGSIHSIAVESEYSSVLSELQGMLGGHDLEGLLRAAPVRNSSLRSDVAKAMGVSDFAIYEAAVRTRLQRDEGLRQQVLDLVAVPA